MANERMSFYLFFLILVGWKQKGVWTLDQDLLQLEINWRISYCGILAVNEIQW
jgi:hypothetical protein